MAELTGNIGLIINIVAVFLLIIGVTRRRGSKEVIIRHGYLSILGFILKLITVFVAMIPPLLTESLELSTFQLWVVGTKVTIGIVGTIMALVCIIPWFSKPVDQMACKKVRKWMTPTLILWISSIV